MDIAGDAIDVSGTHMMVTNTRMTRIGDKGVSAGEESTVEMKNITADTVGIGVASKDLSQVNLFTSEIRNAHFSALAAYIKKPTYGPAKIMAVDVTILDTEVQAVAQTGSTILLNGEVVPTSDLDVDALYQQGILGN